MTVIYIFSAHLCASEGIQKSDSQNENSCIWI